MLGYNDGITKSDAIVTKENMENIIIWIGAIILISIIFIPYLVKFRRSQKAGLAQKQEAESLGADKPVAQYPQIDYYKCITEFVFTHESIKQ